MEIIIYLIIIPINALGFALLTDDGELFDFIAEYTYTKGYKKINHLITCSKCIAGQIALIYTITTLDLFNLIYILPCILFTFLYQKLIDKCLIQ